MKTKIKCIAGIFLFLFIMFGSNRFLTFISMDNVESKTRLTLHELYESPSSIDLLFLGSSHCMRSFDCIIGDDLLSRNTFNAGTSGQFLDGSYTLLKEAGKSNDISEVWVELYYGQLGRSISERTELTSTYAISDYMKPSINKLQFILEASTPAYYSNSFFPARRYWEDLFEPGYIANLLKRKNSEEYLSYSYIEPYRGKGYMGTDTQIAKGTFIYENDFWPINPLTQDDKKYFERIMSYCEKNSIELNFFSAPMSEFRLVSLNNYDDYVSEVTDYLESKGYHYYDLNLCKPEYLALDESYYMDDNHLNTKGGAVVTELICQMIRDENFPYSDAFYSSYNEKIKNQPTQIYGVQLYTTKNSDGSMTYRISPVSNGIVDCVYTISKTINGSNKKDVLQEASENKTFTIPADEQGIINISVHYNNEICNSVKKAYNTKV